MKANKRITKTRERMSLAHLYNKNSQPLGKPCRADVAAFLDNKGYISEATLVILIRDLVAALNYTTRQSTVQ